MENLINKNLTYAIVGANNNPEKYGHKVTKNLIEKGFKIIPVNLTEKEILGIKTYKSLSEIDERVDVVVFIVPPTVTEKILSEVKLLEIRKVWMQPGAESEKAVNFCRENEIEYVYGACMMMESA